MLLHHLINTHQIEKSYQSQSLHIKSTNHFVTPWFPFTLQDEYQDEQNRLHQCLAKTIEGLGRLVSDMKNRQ